MTTASQESVRKSIVVPLSQTDAFRLYTEGIATWWPLKTHSLAKERAATVVLEARVGGRVYERTAEGEERDWGTVVVCESPTRLVHTWHLGRGEATAQEVEVRFAPEGEGTRVDLVHTGWERYGQGAAEAIASYETGWGYVLGECYAAAAAAR